MTKGELGEKRMYYSTCPYHEQGGEGTEESVTIMSRSAIPERANAKGTLHRGVRRYHLPAQELPISVPWL
jgi:hypothetical protein